MSVVLTHWVLCWRVERRDGVTIGLTAHDRDLEIDGVVHCASPGMVPSAVVRSEGLEADTMDVSGALTVAAFHEDDLVAGRWDAARVSVFAWDWRTGARVDLGTGAIGAVETRDGAFTAELTGASAALDRPVAEETSPECRAELGDRRCRVAMAGRRRFARVLAADGATVTLDAAEPVADGWGGGRLRWFGRADGGTVSAIARSEGSTVTLRGVVAAAAGTLVEVIEGCDKSIATCAARFGNAANFRGEPYLPGVDLLTRYPGHDAGKYRGERVAQAARALIGVRFRAQGRGADGLDCVGLAAAALAAGGYDGPVPRGYRLRGGDPERVAASIDAALGRGDGEAAGDLLLCASGPGQLHLAIRVAGGIVHADAGLGRVVERPGAVPWPVLGAWRLRDGRAGDDVGEG